MKQGTPQRRSSFLLPGLIIATISFIVGARSDQIMASIAPALGFRTTTGTLDLSSVQETYRQLKANYDGEIDDKALIFGANRGLAAATGDKHTVYMDPKEVEEFEMSMRGEIGGGIGVEVGLRSERPTVIRPLKGTPAEKAGVEAGDVIVAVNSQSTEGKTIDEITQRIRGDVGSTVKLSVIRQNETKDFSITRQAISSPTVESSIDGETGILTVQRFNDETAQLARAAAEGFIQKGVKRVVLDLRGNPGGTVMAAQALAGLWLDNQTVITERRSGKVVKTLASTGTPILGSIKTIVLINGGSASSSEIVAGALKDYQKATLIGEKSYGKGSVQVLLRLSGGAQLKVTEARWFTPKGKNIEKDGIMPDESIELTAEDVNSGRDPQMERAKQI